MKRKCMIISILIVLFIVGLYCFINKNIIQVRKDSIIKYENDLVGSKKTNHSMDNNIENFENIMQEAVNVDTTDVVENQKEETLNTINETTTNKSLEKNTNVENNKINNFSNKEKKQEKVKHEQKENTTLTIKQEDIKESTQEQTTQVQDKTKEENKVQEPEKTKCSDTKHAIGVGNSNKWFDSKQDAIKYYENIIKTWGDKWTNYETDSETYYKNCPSGYEVFSCPYCEKWTINLFY